MAKTSIKTLNLQFKPKIADTLHPQQIKAMQDFFAHIHANTAGDDYGVYQQAISQLQDLLDIDPTSLSSAAAVEQHREQLFDLYRKVLAIRNDNKIDFDIPDNPQTNIVKACNNFLQEFNKITPQFSEYNSRQQALRDGMTTSNAQHYATAIDTTGKDTQQLQTETLQDIFSSAINTYDNYELTKKQLQILQQSLGQQRFDFFLDRYAITAEKFSLDDCRMLIIGLIGNANTEILNTTFVHNLCAALEVDHRDTAGLYKKLSSSLLSYKQQNDALTRIKSAPPVSRLDRLINFARGWIPKLSLLINERFKVNAKFVNDLETSILAANASQWQRSASRAGADQVLIQKAGSYEYLFHKLAYQDLADSTIVPVVESNGNIEYYKTYSLINQQGFVSMALVPAAADKQDLEVKVLFRGTHDIGSAILDIEQYGAGYKSYRNHEAALLTKLNNIVGKVKADARASGVQSPRISITAGGHSLGGALTQNFYASIIKAKLLPIYKKYRGEPEQLRALLMPIVSKQIAYEAAMKYQKITKSDDITALANKRIDYLLKSLAKYAGKQQSVADQQQARKTKNKSEIAKEDAVQLEDHHLAELAGMNFAIVNSAGAAFKIHDVAADGLALLQDQNPQAIKPSFTNIMVGGDAVQQTGQTTVSASLPAEHIAVDTVKIDCGLEGRNKRLLISAAAFEAAKNLLNLTPGGANLKPPRIEDDPGLSAIVDNLREAHCKIHFDDPKQTIKCDLLSNADDTAKEQVKELTTKVAIVKSQAYQAAKKHILKFVQNISAKVTAVFSKGADLFNNTTAITNLVESDKIKQLANKILGAKPKKIFTLMQNAIKDGKLDLGDAMQQLLPSLAANVPIVNNWQLQLDQLQKTLQADPTWQMEIPKVLGANPTAAMKQFIIAPKSGSTIFKQANQIHVNYEAAAKTVIFAIKSQTPENSTIAQMLNKANACGNTLTLNGDPKLIASALEIAEQQNINNIELSAKAMTRLQQLATSGPSPQRYQQALDILHNMQALRRNLE